MLPPVYRDERAGGCVLPSTPCTGPRPRTTDPTGLHFCRRPSLSSPESQLPDFLGPLARLDVPSHSWTDVESSVLAVAPVSREREVGWCASCRSTSPRPHLPPRAVPIRTPVSPGPSFPDPSLTTLPYLLEFSPSPYHSSVVLVTSTPNFSEPPPWSPSLYLSVLCRQSLALHL